ncbi:zinc finger protein ZFAT-like isoform X2 [Plodia interpunctella]|uniref:zinc finger protein ZFAT-like isoform X2 n=1 Tax=Plodia interpunctella TaxID=58824 RepID=UPI0023688F4F|nr:zinc finger protein ZFAT-like isoform X2 [Plodia interpunctella]
MSYLAIIDLTEKIETFFEKRQIRIMNTKSLSSPRPSTSQPAKKNESLQFKVDIEVEEWIDDELFIEENFAKMQSEKLSEALEKEIKEEVDWTKDEYGKFWADAASDEEVEDRPLNEYEKIIKNQVDPRLIVGPSKAEPEPKKAKLDNKKSNKGDQNKPTPIPNIPKPNLRVKYVKPAKKTDKQKKNEPVKHVSNVNLQPKLKINIVFDDPVPEKPVDVDKSSKKKPVRADALTPKTTKLTPKTTTLTPKDIRPIYIIGDKAVPKAIADKNTDCTEKTKATTSHVENDEEFENVEELLARPIYFIEVNKAAEKINKSQLRNMAYKSVLKKTINDDHILEHIVVNEDEILSVADGLAQQDDEVAKLLNIELRNRLGSARFETLEISREDALVDYAFRQWFAYQGSAKARTVPLLYKCYICNDGWWHLEPFRNHIKKHTYVVVALEKHNQECSIIAHDAKPFKFRMFPIDNECWRCGKSYAFHVGLDQTAYKCPACDSSLYTCLGLKEHMGVCLSVWKKQMTLQATKDIKAYKCKICPQIFFEEAALHKHQYQYHVPRSDYPMLVSVRQCSYCNQNYLLYTFHYCRRTNLQRHICKFCMRHFPSGTALNLHLEDTNRVSKLNVKCKFCNEVVERDCYMMEHVLKHTDKFVLVYKCLACPSNVLLENFVMVQRHVALVHKASKLAWRCAKMIIPTSLYKDHKRVIEYKSNNTTDKKKRIRKSSTTDDPNDSEDGAEVITSTDNQDPNATGPSNDYNDDKNGDTRDDEDSASDVEFIIPEIATETLELEAEDTPETLKLDSVAEDKIKAPKPDSVAEDTIKAPKPDSVAEDTIKAPKPDSVAEDTIKAPKPDSVAEDTIKAPKLDSVADDTTESTIQETTETTDIDVKPTIKIKNVSDDCCEQESPKDTEINIKPILPVSVASIKMEVDDVGAAINVSELLEFEEMPVKQEINDVGETSKSSAEQFSEQIQNFLDYEATSQNGIDDLCVCSSCDFEGTSREYKVHMCKSFKNELEHEKRECTKCEKIFNTMKEYVKHLRVHGYTMCRCKECNLEFPSLSSWILHINSHINRSFARVKLLSSDSPVFICKICRDIVHRNMFFKHWEVHIHQDISVAVHYKSDGIISRKLLEVILDIFQASVTRNIPKVCVVCGREFARMNEKKRHLVEHLLEAAAEDRGRNRSLRCQICSAGFEKTDQFRRHMRDHAGLPVYHCELCDKTFSDSSNFVKHKKVHNLETYVCDVCNKKFVAKSSLVAHIATHSPEPIICIRCPDRSFYSESMYRRHVRTYHDKVSYYTCNMCRKRFSSVKEKWDHQWEEHKMRSQIADCPECGEKFRKVTDVRKHLALVHSVSNK